MQQKRVEESTRTTASVLKGMTVLISWIEGPTRDLLIAVATDHRHFTDRFSIVID